MPTALNPAEIPWDELLSGPLQPFNLVFFGPTGQSTRLSRLIYMVLVHLVNEKGQSAFSHVLVLLPPDQPDTIAQDVVADVPQHRGSALDAHELAVLSKRLQVQRVASFETAAVVRVLEGVQPGTFIVLTGAARYRPAEAKAVPPGSLQAPEDQWMPHLIELASRCEAIVAKPNCMVMDVGQYAPALGRNERALEELGCTVWSMSAPQVMDDQQMMKMEDWTRRIERGDIVSVLAEIDQLPRLSEDAKVLCKIQLLHKGGRSGRALEILRSHAPQLENAPADIKLKLATVALAGEDTALATQLLESSGTQLNDLGLNELALKLTQSVPSAVIERQSSRWLARYFPVSSTLEQHQLRRVFLAARDKLALQPDANWPLPLDEYGGFVTSRLAASAIPDYLEMVEQAEARWPERRSDTCLAAVLNARARELPMHVASLASEIDARSPVARHAANALLWSIERLLLLGGDASSEELSDAVLFVLGYLASAPSDTSTRERLDELLSVDIAGFAGVALLAHALMRLAAAPVAAPIAVPPTGPEFEAEPFWAFYRAALEWLHAQGAIDLARLVLPAQLLSLSADTALENLKDLAQYMLTQEQKNDAQSLRMLVTVAFAVAPHAPHRYDDLEILRLVSGSLVIHGNAQLARDLVEAGLTTAHGKPQRLRLAWYAYGDVFHRMRNRSRALLAFGCALATQAPVGLENAYYETMGLVRVLRDTGLMEQARELLRACDQLLVQLGNHAKMAHRIETVRVSIRLGELSSRQPDDGPAWSALLQAVDANLQAVVRQKDEMTPVLILAAQILRHVEALGLVVDPPMRARLQAATKGVGEVTGGLVEMASHAAIGVERLLEAVQAAQQARYAEDVGFDVQWLVRAARAQLSQEASLVDPVTASFVVELNTDHAISLPGGLERTWLPTTLAEPAAVLQELSRRGVCIELLAVDSDDKLVRVSAQAGELSVHREEAAFSLQALHAWSLRFPYEYGLDGLDPNVFYTSMRGLNLSQPVGDRTLFVLDTRLQRLPPQLLLIDDELLGRTTAVAVAPSLTWLKAITSAPRPRFEPPAAWISTAIGVQQPTLIGVAERVTDVLEHHGIALNTGAEVPDHLKGAQLAIVAAHGGLADENRFFNVISNEAQLRLSGPTLARALEGAGVAVLFVCSGGRQDEHPVASTTVGLPKQLLDRGSAAVIASPWPLDSRVPSHWLPAFLEAWAGGAMLIDANAAGNLAVAQQMGDNPARVMAMTLYGDPFLRRQDLTG